MLDVIANENLLARSEALGAQLRQSITALNHPSVAEVRGLGSMSSVEFKNANTGLKSIKKNLSEIKKSASPEVKKQLNYKDYILELENRKKILYKFIDHLLLLFPFEKKYFEGFIRNSFVGHPFFDFSVFKINKLEDKNKKYFTLCQRFWFNSICIRYWYSSRPFLFLLL